MAAKRKTIASICLEGLESRQLMSVSVFSGQLHIAGSESNDRITVQQDAANITVTEQVLFFATRTTKVPTSSVTSIFANLRGGNDTLTMSSTVTRPANVLAGNGNDRVESGSGNDLLFGGDGADTIFGGNGSDQIKGSTGKDFLYGGTPSQGRTSDLGFGNDLISGEADNDYILGSFGNDTINGGDGDDKLDGTRGNDLINGGNNNDTLTGGVGVDTLRGEFGDDTFFARDGVRDRVEGGAGFDSASIDGTGQSLDFTGDLVTSIQLLIA